MKHERADGKVCRARCLGGGGGGLSIQPGQMS